jgi:hypothetical protein
LVKSRRGRKRKTMAARHPDGRTVKLTEKQRVQDIVSVVREARQRVFGIDPDEMPETSVIGALKASGEISRRQFDALDRYREIVQDHRRYTLARPLPSAGNLDRTHGHDDSSGEDPSYVLRFNVAMRLYERCTDALRRCPDAFVTSVVDMVVMGDQFAPHFIGSLRIGANELARELGLPDASAGQRIDRRGVPEYR